MKNKKIIKYFLGGFLISLVLPLIANAGFFDFSFDQGLVPCGTSQTHPCTFCDLFKLGENIINLMYKIAVLGGMLFLMWGGFTMMTAAGSPDRFNAGKKIIWSAIIGITIAFAAGIILDIFFQLLSGSAGAVPWNTIRCR